MREGLTRRQGGEEDFRWRGEDVSRIEGFSDAVFAFAVTLLVVSLEVPKTFDELLATMRGFFAFAICFALLLTVWYDHYKFFRRYGLKDTPTRWLNSTLLFLMLLYVYPLKFLFTMLIDEWFGFGNSEMIEASQVPLLLVIYGAGFVAIQLVFFLMYLRAYSLRAALELDSQRAVGDARGDAGLLPQRLGRAGLGGHSRPRRCRGDLPGRDWSTCWSSLCRRSTPALWTPAEGRRARPTLRPGGEDADSEGS